MIYTPANCQAILEGYKTQTRRPRKEEDWIISRLVNGVEIQQIGNKSLKWSTWRTYALQPGRGKKGIAHIRFTHFELQELQDITEEDAIAEGIGCIEFSKMDPAFRDRYYAPGDLVTNVGGIYYIPYIAYTAVEAYRIQWDRLYKRQPELQWEQNPKVWVLDGIELA